MSLGLVLIVSLIFESNHFIPVNKIGDHLDLETREILSSCRSNPIRRHIHALSPYRNDNNLIIVIARHHPWINGRHDRNFAFVSSIAGGSFALREQEVITGQWLRETSVFRAEYVCRSFDTYLCENSNYCRNVDGVFFFFVPSTTLASFSKRFFSLPLKILFFKLIILRSFNISLALFFFFLNLILR